MIFELVCFLYQDLRFRRYTGAVRVGYSSGRQPVFTGLENLLLITHWRGEGSLARLGNQPLRNPSNQRNNLRNVRSTRTLSRRTSGSACSPVQVRVDSITHQSLHRAQHTVDRIRDHHIARHNGAE